MKPFKIIIVFTLFIISCDKNNAPITSDSDPSITGTSSFVFDSYLPFADKPMNVFYHVPENINTQTPILFVLHGSGRNAAQYRDAFVTKSEQLGFIIVVPEFNDIDFPGGDAYNLANCIRITIGLEKDLKILVTKTKKILKEFKNDFI